MHWANGDYYEGLYENGFMHGQGTYRHADGTRYQGQFTENLREGYGICTFTNGSLYEGSWLKDKPEGEGRVLYASGEVVVSTFKDGVQEMKHDPKSEARQAMVGVKSYDAARSYQKPTQIPGLPDLPPLPPMQSLQTLTPPPLLALGDGEKTRLPVAAPPKPPPLNIKKGPGQPQIPLPELQPLKLADESVQLAPPLPKSRPPSQARPPPQGRPPSRGLAQAPVANLMDRPAPLSR
jgi:hypothetical protein